MHLSLRPPEAARGPRPTISPQVSRALALTSNAIAIAIATTLAIGQ